MDTAIWTVLFFSTFSFRLQEVLYSHARMLYDYLYESVLSWRSVTNRTVLSVPLRCRGARTSRSGSQYDSFRRNEDRCLGSRHHRHRYHRGCHVLRVRRLVQVSKTSATLAGGGVPFSGCPCIRKYILEVRQHERYLTNRLQRILPNLHLRCSRGQRRSD